jgi:hypothetical protein
MSESNEAMLGDHVMPVAHSKGRRWLAAVAIAIFALDAVGGGMVMTQERHGSTTNPAVLPPAGTPPLGAAPSPAQLTLDLVRPCVITQVRLPPGGSVRISPGDDSSPHMTSKTCDVAKVH